MEKLHKDMVNDEKHLESRILAYIKEGDLTPEERVSLYEYINAFLLDSNNKLKSLKNATVLLGGIASHLSECGYKTEEVHISEVDPLTRAIRITNSGNLKMEFALNVAKRFLKVSVRIAHGDDAVLTQLLKERNLELLGWRRVDMDDYIEVFKHFSIIYCKENMKPLIDDYMFFLTAI